MLVGTPVFGYLGDRFGRKPLIIFSTLLFGSTTWGTILATNVEQLFVLRLITGLGLAGIIPNVTALVSELTPRRVRGAALMVVQLGVQVGSIVPGLIAAFLVSNYGWQILFVVGGLCPMIIAAAFVFVLPESIKYLCLRPARRADLVRLVEALDSSAIITGNTQFALATPDPGATLSPAAAFRDGMHVITPLLWCFTIISLFTNLLLASWAPTILRDVGLSPSAAAVTASLYAVGAVIGSIILTFGFNRYGFLIVVVFYLIAGPAMALIGQTFISTNIVPWLVALAGLCVGGTQSAINSALGMLYPTSIRANSAGWGMAIGRLGAIAGPLAGGYLVAQHVSAQAFFEASALPVLLGLCVAIPLTYHCRKRFKVWTLDERPG